MNLYSRSPTDKIIGYWLFVIAAMVFVMVVIGGLTRLTGSGLSMVDWHPVTGWFPPLNDKEWLAVFELYKQSPEYQKVNFGMNVNEFKGIFWLEFFHRLWGRFIGVAFALPFLFFLFKGWIGKKQIFPLVTLFVLGGAQGGLGWYMVKSGLVDNPEVSQYRLMAHLGFAFILYAALIWTGMKYFCKVKPYEKPSYILQATFLWICTFITILAGALVAGLDAGLTYNTFPLMDGDLVPSGMYDATPWFLNHFENITLVQFQHRWLAILTSLLVILLYVQFKRDLILKWCLIVVIAQAVLGVSTLINVVPIELASMHQAGGLIVFTLLTLLNFKARH